MKKWSIILLSVLLASFLVACGGGETAVESEQDSEIDVSQALEPETDASESENLPASSSDPSVGMGESTEENDETNILVAYFSYAENAALPDDVDASATASIQVWNDGTTGNTGVVAAIIAEATGADLFSIQTVEQYPDTYDATLDRGQEERNAGARPELVAYVENLEKYDVIFLGYPNWWGDMPMALYSFLDEEDLSGKTIVPFVTSGGSGFSDTIRTIESMEPDANVQDGLAIRDTSVTDADDQITEWLGGLGYIG